MTLHLRHEIMWNANLMQLGNDIDVFLARHVSGTCVVCTVRMVPCDARHHPHTTHDPRSGSQDHHPSKNAVQKTIGCNSTSNTPDDVHMYPKHVELRIYQYHYLIASSWHSKLLHFVL